MQRRMGEMQMHLFVVVPFYGGYLFILLCLSRWNCPIQMPIAIRKQLQARSRKLTSRQGTSTKFEHTWQWWWAH